MEQSKRILAMALCVLAFLPVACAFMMQANSIVPSAAVRETVTEVFMQTPTEPTVETATEPVVETATELRETPHAAGMQSLTTEQVERVHMAKGGITTAMIQAVCDKYGYRNGKYWSIYENDGLMATGDSSGSYLADRENCCSVRSATVAYRLDASDHPVENGNYYKSYNYMNQYECHGFACYVMAKVVQRKTGRNHDVVPRMGNRNGWERIPADKAKNLKVGDIVRIESATNEHSAVVYSIDQKGKATFLESGGGAACRIRLGKGFNFSEELDTLEKIRSHYTLEYIYRYTGKQ